MIKKASIFILSLFLFSTSQAQEFVSELYGFKIGQYRKAASELGKPAMQGKYNDGFEYDVFLLSPDSSAYIVFEYSANELDLIWSIQVAGKDREIELGFKKLKLEMDSSKVLTILGSPTQREDAGVYGMRWEYRKGNYSVEINNGGKLSSVKIKETNFNTKADASKIPSFDMIVKKLTSTKNADIASILAPDIQVSYNNTGYLFSKSIATEIRLDESSVFKTIKLLAKDLGKINAKDKTVYEESIRLVQGQETMHVIKIKKGSLIKEIVLKYVHGEYLIWEINT